MLIPVVVLLSMIVGYRCLNVVMGMRLSPCCLLNIDVSTVSAIVPVSYEGSSDFYKTLAGLEPRHENFQNFLALSEFSAIFAVT